MIALEEIVKFDCDPTLNTIFLFASVALPKISIKVLDVVGAVPPPADNLKKPTSLVAEFLPFTSLKPSSLLGVVPST